jgi:hypothetical protein
VWNMVGQQCRVGGGTTTQWMVTHIDHVRAQGAVKTDWKLPEAPATRLVNQVLSDCDHSPVNMITLPAVDPCARNICTGLNYSVHGRCSCVHANLSWHHHTQTPRCTLV